MARAAETFRSVFLVIVTPSTEGWEGRGVYGDGDGGCHDTKQAGVIQKRQRNQISPLSLRNLQSPLPPCSIFNSVAPTTVTPHSNVHQHKCSCIY
jgi:hypothetical protein